jgi:hypothetical protein
MPAAMLKPRRCAAEIPISAPSKAHPHNISSPFAPLGPRLADGRLPQFTLSYASGDVLKLLGRAPTTTFLTLPVGALAPAKRAQQPLTNQTRVVNRVVMVQNQVIAGHSSTSPEWPVFRGNQRVDSESIRASAR